MCVSSWAFALHQFALFVSYSFLVSIVNNEGGNYMLFLGLSVPGEVPQCSASVLTLLACFLNSDNESSAQLGLQAAWLSLAKIFLD